MKHTTRFPSLLAALLLPMLPPCGRPAAAQTDAAQRPPVRTVYLEDVRLKGRSRFDKDVEIDNFAQKLIELRLAELKSYEVLRENPPACKGAGGGAALAPPAPEPQESGGEDADYYVIRASIDVRPAEKEKEPEVALEYELLRYVQCQPVSLIHNARPFAESESLKYFVSMAEVLGSVLERERAVKLQVEVVPFTAADPELRPVAADLTNAVQSKLSKSPDFELRRSESPSAAAFTLRGQLAPGERLGLRLTITSKSGRPVDREVSEGPSRRGLNEELLKTFYENVSDKVLALLQQERRLADQARLGIRDE